VLSSTTGILEEMNAAVEAFVSVFESRPGVLVTDHKLENHKMMEAESSNYISTGIVRLNFTFRDENSTDDDNEFIHRSSVVLKIPRLGVIHQFGQELLFYQKEKYMYEEVVSRMRVLWPRHEEPPFPHFYAALQSGTLVLENLLERGFRTKPRDSAFDLIECESVLSSLARFHALSVELADEPHATKLDSLTRFDWGSHSVAASFVPLLAKFEKHFLGRDPPIVSEGARKAIEQLRNEGGYASAIKLGYSPNKHGLNVILHGDAHRFNMLFRRRDKERVECKLIDFQGSRRGSPVLDLMYFLVTNVHFKIFDHHRESLFAHYLRVFAETREEANARTPAASYSSNELNADFHQYKSFFHYVLIIFVPLVWTGRLQIPGQKQEDVFDELLKSAEYISYFKGWIKHFE
jgi:hypothetical protein